MVAYDYTIRVMNMVNGCHGILQPNVAPAASRCNLCETLDVDFVLKCALI